MTLRAAQTDRTDDASAPRARGGRQRLAPTPFFYFGGYFWPGRGSGPRVV